MNTETFLKTPEINDFLAESFMLLAATGDTFNVTETVTDGYYNHVTIADQDEDGKSFAKTLKLSNVGAGCVSAGHAALHILSALFVIVNEEQIVDDFDIEHYTVLLADTIKNVKNTGLANVV